MFLSKLLAGTTIALALASGILYLMYERAVAEKEKAEVVAKSAEAAMTQIEGLFDQQKQEFDLIRKSIDAQQETFDEYFDKVSSLEHDLGEARLEISKLRASELNKAIAAPFDRGDTARDRLNNSVQRIRGNRENTSGGGAANSDNAGT